MHFMLNQITTTIICCCLALSFTMSSYAADKTIKLLPTTKSLPYDQRPAVLKFIKLLVTRHDFDSKVLLAAFSEVKTNKSVLRTIKRTAETTKTWPQYKRILVTDRRIANGVRFASTHKALLNRAEKEYGVPSAVILAILGIETRYGAFQGRHKVFHTLTTLAFNGSKRSAFFKKELEQFLLLVREQNFDIQSVRGSFAGAMGYGQFIPSSYRHYAVDYDGDAIKDLFGNVNDAVGSVAYYLKKNGWKHGGPIALRANAKTDADAKVVNQDKIPRYSLTELAGKGFVLSDNLDEDHKAFVLAFDLKNSQEHWLAFKNFGVIMRYNPRYFYAMAVYQLSLEIEKGIAQ